MLYTDKQEVLHGVAHKLGPVADHMVILLPCQLVRWPSHVTFGLGCRGIRLAVRVIVLAIAVNMEIIDCWLAVIVQGGVPVKVKVTATCRYWQQVTVAIAMTCFVLLVITQG